MARMGSRPIEVLFLAAGCGLAIASVTLWLANPRYISYEEAMEAKSNADPEPGVKVVLPVDATGVGEGRHLLILLGNCTSCSTGTQGLATLDLTKWPSVFAVTTAEKVDWAVLPKAKIKGITGDEYLHQVLNAYWTPRLAVVGKGGSLIALARMDESHEEFLGRNAE